MLVLSSAKILLANNVTSFLGVVLSVKSASFWSQKSFGFLSVFFTTLKGSEELDFSKLALSRRYLTPPLIHVDINLS